MSDITVSTGARVAINPADFRDAMALKNAIQREFAKSNVSIKFDSDIDSIEIARLIMLVDSSTEVNALIWPCLVRCTYNGEKITEKTFENVEARKDYYDIILACARENLSPFFESALSKLKKLQIGSLLSAGQKSA